MLASLEDLIYIVPELPSLVLVPRSVSRIRRAEDCEVRKEDVDRCLNRHLGDLTRLRPEGTDVARIGVEQQRAFGSSGPVEPFTSASAPSFEVHRVTLDPLVCIS